MDGWMGGIYIYPSSIINTMGIGSGEYGMGYGVLGIHR